MFYHIKILMNKIVFKKNDKKQLQKKRKANFTLVEMIKIYSKQHNIKDDEITEKIKSIHYKNFIDNTTIDYEKDNGDKFPIPVYKLNKKQEKNFSINNNKVINEKNDENEKSLSDEENKKLLECFICQWKFLKKMSIQEKNQHINCCLEGKGEENIKQLTDTYNEIENIIDKENIVNDNIE